MRSTPTLASGENSLSQQQQQQRQQQALSSTTRRKLLFLVVIVVIMASSSSKLTATTTILPTAVAAAAFTTSRRAVHARRLLLPTTTTTTTTTSRAAPAILLPSWSSSSLSSFSSSSTALLAANSASQRRPQQGQQQRQRRRNSHGKSRQRQRQPQQRQPRREPSSFWDEIGAWENQDDNDDDDNNFSWDKEPETTQSPSRGRSSSPSSPRSSSPRSSSSSFVHVENKHHQADTSADTLPDAADITVLPAWCTPGTPIQVEIVSFGPLGASVDVVAHSSHDEHDIIPETQPPLATGLILQREIRYFRQARNHVDVVRGEILPAYIERVRDLTKAIPKLDITLRAYGGKAKADATAQRILELLHQQQEEDGQDQSELPVGDKSSPDEIAAWFPGVSKAAFKRAVAMLYKQDRVRPGPYSVVLLQQQNKNQKEHVKANDDDDRVELERPPRRQHSSTTTTTTTRSKQQGPRHRNPHRKEW